mgnify:FL=1
MTRQLNKMPAPRSWRAPAILLIGAMTLSFSVGAAEARCKSLEVLDAVSVCNSGECPSGEYIYSIRLRNKATKRLYVAYRFKGPDGRLTLGGLDIAPQSDIERPIGFGLIAITDDEPAVTRQGRFRPAKCGFNERTKFSWKK